MQVSFVDLMRDLRSKQYILTAKKKLWYKKVLVIRFYENLSRKKFRSNRNT